MVVAVFGVSITAIAELQNAEPILTDAEQQPQTDLLLEQTTPNEASEETNDITADVIAEEIVQEQEKEKIPIDQLLIQRLLTKEQQEELASLPKDPLKALEFVAKKLSEKQTQE